MNDNTQKQADESAAALALVTKMSEGMMPKVAPESPVEPSQTSETAPKSTQEPELEERVGEVEKKLDMEEYMADMEVRLDEKLESFKEDLLKAINKE